MNSMSTFIDIVKQFFGSGFKALHDFKMPFLNVSILYFLLGLIVIELGLFCFELFTHSEYHNSDESVKESK